MAHGVLCAVLFASVVLDLHHVSKNFPPLACYNSDTCERILIFFGRKVTDKQSNQKTLLCHIK